MRTKQRVVQAVVAGAVMVPVLAGCALIPGNGCEEPDEAIVDELMAHAKTDFVAGESRIERLEFREAAQGELPEELRRFGATDIVVIRGVSYFKNAVSDELAGVHVNNTFVIDDEGHPVGALDTFARKGFDIQAPDEPGWDAWVERVNDSSVELDVSQCVKE